MKIGVADRNIVTKIYCRCLSTFLILDLTLFTGCFSLVPFNLCENPVHKHFP